MKHLAAWQQKRSESASRGPVRWREQLKGRHCASPRLLWSRQKGRGQQAVTYDAAGHRART